MGPLALNASEGEVPLYEGLGARVELLAHVHAAVVQHQGVVLLCQVVIDAVQVLLQAIQGMPVTQRMAF